MLNCLHRDWKKYFPRYLNGTYPDQPAAFCDRLCACSRICDPAGTDPRSLPKVFQFINPILQIIRPIAPVAFLPFIVFWFGIGDVPAIVIIFIAGFFPILLSVVAAVQHVDGIYYKIANSFGVGKVKTLFGIVFPAIFTQIANALRLALGTSWIFLVSGEMVGAQSGLGFLIMDSKNCMRLMHFWQP